MSKYIILVLMYHHHKLLDLINLITEPLPNNGHLCGTSLTALFWLSGIMSHVTHVYIVM
jgi:hypothetical protein